MDTIVLECYRRRRPDGTASMNGFLVRWGDEVLLDRGSDQPLYAGCRALLARGIDSATPVSMRHAGSDVHSFLPTTVGAAAGKSVHEIDNGPHAGIRTRKYQPFPGRDAFPC